MSVAGRFRDWHQTGAVMSALVFFLIFLFIYFFFQQQKYIVIRNQQFSKSHYNIYACCLIFHHIFVHFKGKELRDEVILYIHSKVDLFHISSTNNALQGKMSERSGVATGAAALDKTTK